VRNLTFASVDIETTGLDPNKDSVLEIAAGIGEVKARDEFANINDMSSHIYAPMWYEIRMLVIPRAPITAELYILSMHSRLWGEMAKYDKLMGKDKQVIKVDLGLNPNKQEFWVVRRETVYPIFRSWFKARNPDGFMNVAGKNYAGFDARFLRRIDPGFDDMFRARVIDPAPLYFRHGDEKMPSTEMCLERLKVEWPEMPSMSEHSAMDDARAVTWMIRAGFLRR
jgi:hypothetical protein